MVRRLLLIVLAGLAAYALLQRRRTGSAVTIGYLDGSSVMLGGDGAGVGPILAAARDVLRT